MKRSISIKKRYQLAYWIWLQFDNRSTETCKRLQAYSQRTLKSPYFKPHLTISGPYLDVNDFFVSRLKILSTSLKPFEVSIKSIDYKDEYFESFFLKISKSKKILNLKNYLDKTFSPMSIDANYMPHVSLAYSDSKEIKKINLLKNMPQIPRSLNISKLSLAHSDEIEQKWQIIYEFDLSKNNNCKFN